ncbi:MAG: carboxypeptidase-like regulatory domain-containing protein [Paludibacteraceae bacterium]|nr:carboxypeptidase-like regulatory domain-containing protein [Paludibacteraceae bacterium]
MKKILTTLIVLSSFVSAWSQATLKGKIVDSSTGEPIAGASVTLANQNITTTTNEAGEFQLLYLDAIDEEVLIDAEGYESGIELVEIAADQTTTIPPISLQPDMAQSANQEVYLNILEQDFNDDEGRTQEQSSAASSSMDVFNNITSFAWSTGRYRNRGYEQRYEQNYIEGLPFNSQERGQFNFSAMGGLNDASRYKETVNPMEASNFAFGGLGQSTNYLMSASNYAQGWKVGAAGTNRNYKAALRATYSSGPLKHNWYVATQLAFRFSPYTEKKGQIGEGIDYYSLGYFITAEKRWERDQLSIITFGAPTSRGQSGAVTQEVYNLTNQFNKNQWGWNNYNPYWGYQNGKMRNSRIVHSFDPTLLVSYKHTLNEKQTIHAAVGYHYSLYSNSALSFYNAPDPRPDYYRNLPSFLWDGQLTENGDFIHTDYAGRPLGKTDGDGLLEDPASYNGTGIGHSIDYNSYKALTDLWTSRDDKATQIDWEALYLANYANNHTNPEGSARYIVERRHNDIQEAAASFRYTDVQFNHLRIIAGAEVKYSEGDHYKTIDDLLGGKQWIDIDPFAERDIKELATNINMTQGEIEFVKQNDLNNPNHKTGTDERFGYDYQIAMAYARIWAQNEWNWQDLDLSYSLALTYSSMQRSTQMLNGRAVYLATLNPAEAELYLGKKADKVLSGIFESSYTGANHSFIDPAFKLALNYKINGRNHIKLNTIAQTQAPWARDAYISQRVHDRVIENIYTHDHAQSLSDYYAASEKIVGADLTYEFNYPVVRGRITGFFTQFWNGSELNGYYDDEARTFVNQALSGINRRHVGGEAAVAVKLGTYFTLTGAASIGDFRYTSNAYSVTSAENGMALDESVNDAGKNISVYEVRDSVLIKGLHVSNGPQLNASLKLSFFHPKMWFADITLTYYDWNWLDYAPARRMQGLYYGVRADGTSVNGSYAQVYMDHDRSFDARQLNEDGSVALDKYGTPLLEEPYQWLAAQESLVSDKIWHRFVIDMSFGKLIYLPNRQSLSINLSVTNLTNNVNLKTSGFQQARLPRSTRQGEADGENSTINSNIWKFPSKYYYAWGTNFYFTMTYKF